jgi:hypothetical protein
LRADGIDVPASFGSEGCKSSDADDGVVDQFREGIRRLPLQTGRL